MVKFNVITTMPHPDDQDVEGKSPPMTETNTVRTLIFFICQYSIFIKSTICDRVTGNVIIDMYP